MFRAVLLDKHCWTLHMQLDPETGLDPPGVKLRAAQGKLTLDEGLLVRRFGCSRLFYCWGIRSTF